MDRTVDGPSTEVCENALRLLTRNRQLPCGDGVELREHLNTQGSGPVLKQAAEQFNRSFVLPAGASVVCVDEHIGIDEFNAHATLPGSNGRPL